MYIHGHQLNIVIRVLAIRSILAKHWPHFHDWSGWLQILLLQWISKQLLHLWCKSVVKNLKIANHMDIKTRNLRWALWHASNVESTMLTATATRQLLYHDRFSFRFSKKLSTSCKTDKMKPKLHWAKLARKKCIFTWQKKKKRLWNVAWWRSQMALPNGLNIFCTLIWDNHMDY